MSQFLAKFIIVITVMVLTITKTTVAQEKVNLKVMQETYRLYAQGEYYKVLDELTKIEEKAQAQNKKKLLGIIAYWRGLALAKTNEYEAASKSFARSLKNGWKPKDIYYELAQSLYIADNLNPAITAFKNSVKVRYKRAVSLYYIGFIYQQKKNYSKAVSYFKLIQKLPEEETKDVLQPALAQIGDIYLEQAKDKPDAFIAVEEYVIPQYEEAIEVNDESSLANELRIKIRKLLKDYEILLFRLRNGKVTAIPRYFASANLITGYNDNVNNLSDADRESATEDVASLFTTATAFTRYSFYPSNWFSIAPEFRAGMTKHYSNTKSIIENDNSFYRIGLKMNYEHLYNNAPATTYIDIEYQVNNRDDNQDGTLEQNNAATIFTISEELQLFKDNISIFRLRYTDTVDTTEQESFTTTSFIYENIKRIGAHTLVGYLSYDMNRYELLESSNNNSIYARVDWLFPAFWGIGIPSINAALVQTDFPNIDNQRAGLLSIYGLSLTKKINRKWYLTNNINYSVNSDENEANEYTQLLVSFALEYIF
jgi:hypothetical protein